MRHTGRAVVFESVEELHRAVDDDGLDIDEGCVMVLKNCGPKGYPGMAEVGNMPLPQKLLRRGVRDMVRISDARSPAPPTAPSSCTWRPRRRPGGRSR